MSDDKNAKVDPRFDPAFQRGFDQSIPIEEYVPAPAPRTPPVAPSPAPAVEPLRAAKPPVPRPAPAPLAEAAPPVVGEEQADESDLESAPETDLESNPARNPFLLFLCIIAIALVAAGVWLFVRSGDAFNSREVRSQGDYMSLDATINMAPFIALLGAATAIGVLFVFASKWKRRR